MSSSKKGEQALAGMLKKLSVELNKVVESSGLDVSSLDSLRGGEELASVNQSCNGICRSLEDLGKASEVEVTRAATAAAVYNIRQFKEIASLGILDTDASACNQGCNGICEGSSSLEREVVGA